MTFGRMATGELRERVRERLVTAERGLADALDGVTPPPGDEVLAPPRQRPPTARWTCAAAASPAPSPTSTQRRSPPPTASASTCSRASGSPPTSTPTPTFVDDPTDLVEEVVDDLYVRKFHRYSPPFGLDEAVRIGKTAVFNPGVRARAGERRPRQRSRRCAGASPWPSSTSSSGASAASRCSPTTTCSPGSPARFATLSAGRRPRPLLRERYRVALVDEFQDTDPTQWEIVRTAFGDGRHDARAHRRSEAGDLRLPRRRRVRLPRRRRQRHDAGDARRQLAQRPGVDRRLRRVDGRGAARPRRDRVPHRPRRRRPPAATTDRCAGARRVARARAPSRRRARRR